MTGQPDRREFMALSAFLGASYISGKPVFASESLPHEKALTYQKEIPVGRAYDVVVCGGGPSGISSALSASRAGLKVLLVEGQGQLGGMGTSGHVSQWLGGRTRNCQKWAVGGIFREISQKATDCGAALLPMPPANGRYSPHGWSHSIVHGVPFDPFAVAELLDRMTIDAEIDTLLLTQAVDVRIEKNRITHVILFNKSGMAAVPAKAFIDATGDADIAARSGCEVEKGRPEDHLMTPATLIFHVYNVDPDVLSEYIHNNHARRFREKIKALRAAGDWPFPYDIFISVQLTDKDVFMINTSRLVGIDGTDGKSMTEGMIRGRHETQQLMRIMRKHFPGFENAKIKTVAPLLGVRETRRIVGDFILTVEDVLEQRPFDDIVGFSSYGWDLPDPKRPSYQPFYHDRKKAMRHEVTAIPYHIMVPRPLRNLICPGRAVSVERDVLGPLRVSGPCFAMGQAAGQAARQVVQNGVDFAQVDCSVLRSELAKADAIIDWKD